MLLSWVSLFVVVGAAALAAEFEAGGFEDIEIDFNSNDDYWPRSDQSDQYPGAGTYRDPYFMGFFAGITIESDYVTIDLNGYELKQSLKFYPDLLVSSYWQTVSHLCSNQNWSWDIPPFQQTMHLALVQLGD